MSDDHVVVAQPGEMVTAHLEQASRAVWYCQTRLGLWRESSSPLLAREDLLSEAYLGLVSAVTTWQPERGDFQRYAYFCCVWAVLGHVQRVKGRGKHAPVFLPMDHTDVVRASDTRQQRDDNPLRGYARGQTRARLVRAMRRLTPTQRDVVLAWVRHGCGEYGSMRRIAAQRGCSEHAVKQVRQAAFESMRRALGAI